MINVLILGGGYGVFGKRLAAILGENSHFTISVQR